MKILRNVVKAGLTSLVVVLMMSSCQKGFDAKTYAPSKPLPSFGGFTSSKEIEPASLVAYWPFSNSLADSISKKDGTASGTSFSAGIAGQGFQGAAKSYALCDAPPALATLQSFTISTWVNTPPPSTGVIGFFSFANTVNFWGNLEMFFENGSDNTNGKVRVHISQAGNDYTYSIDNVAGLFNAWVNIAVSYNQDTGNCTLYVNGASKNVGKATAGSASLSGPLTFTNPGKVTFGTVQFMTTPSQTTGSGPQDWASYLTGELDQVRIYSKPLTTAEVSALYNLDKVGK